MVYISFYITLLCSTIRFSISVDFDEYVDVENDHRNGRRLEDLLFPTPFPKVLKNIVPKDVEEFKKQPSSQYQINPTSKQELQNLIAYSENFLPNLYVDSVNLTSQQFEEIRTKYEKRKAEDKKKGKGDAQTALPLDNSKKDKRNREGIEEQQKIIIERATNLMAQFVYGARYKLQYGQRLRTAYNKDLEYQLGYCFALIRDIKQQQMTLYSTMHFNLQHFYEGKESGQESYADLESYIQIYEKIVRLDIDMMDMINFVRGLEELRKNTTTTTTEAGAAG